MPNIKEVRDGGENPNTPTIEQARESQAKGSRGIGLNVDNYAEMQAHFNMGTGLDGDPDKPSYPTRSNDENAEE